MAAETKHVIVLEINEEHHVQIKHIYYSCIYLNYFSKLNFFLILCFMKNGVCGLFGDSGYL
jgi:hypothetical protein